METGAFVVSLDFELFWGMRDVKTLDEYRENLLGVRKAIPTMLKLFSEYGVHATWSTVGMLFFESKAELVESFPDILPEYKNKVFSPYDYIKEAVGKSEKTDLYHFAPSLIKKINSCPNQRIGTHTFSHYYCLEPGQDIRSFEEDLSYAIKVAKQREINLESLVFPRNQYSEEYLEICRKLGISSFRGNAPGWLYRARSQGEESLFRRACRLADSYINLAGHNTLSWRQLDDKMPVNIPASRFLRPYSKRLRALEPLKISRIKSDLTFAAKKNHIYHLWWHPHNFGVNQDKNFYNLELILKHYSELKKKYNFQSLNMEEVSEKIKSNHNSSNL